MTIYQTENEEIINIYNLYLRVKNFIVEFENKKNNFINYYGITYSNTYYKYPNGKYGYNSSSTIANKFFNEVEKEFNEEYIKILNLNDIYNTIYFNNILDNNLYMKKGNLNIKTYNNFDKFHNNILKKFKSLLKKILYYKLNNKEILNF